MTPDFSFYDDCERLLFELLLQQPLGVVLAKRYELVERLGHGELSTVYKAVDKKLSRGQKETVYRAVKLIRQDTFKPPQFDRLLDEASALKFVSGISDSFVQIHDADRMEHGEPYIVMEAVSGIVLKNKGKEERVYDLQKYLTLRGPMSRRHAAEIIYTISSALDLIHRTKISSDGELNGVGLAHGDLKPANILLAHVETARNDPRRLPFRPKIADFGVDAGTPGYMAPEQVAASGEASPSADVWAMGIILAQLVTGKLPIRISGASSEGRLQSQSAVFEQLRQLNAKSLEVLPLGDSDLTEICRRCLTLDPAKRYRPAGKPLPTSQSIQFREPLGRQHSELTEALERWLSHRPLTPPLGQSPPLRRFTLWAKRKPVRAIITLTLLLAALIAAAMGLERHSRETHLSKMAEQRALAHADNVLKNFEQQLAGLNFDNPQLLTFVAQVDSQRERSDKAGLANMLRAEQYMFHVERAYAYAINDATEMAHQALTDAQIACNQMQDYDFEDATLPQKAQIRVKGLNCLLAIVGSDIHGFKNTMSQLHDGILLPVNNKAQAEIIRRLFDHDEFIRKYIIARRRNLEMVHFVGDIQLRLLRELGRFDGGPISKAALVSHLMTLAEQVNPEDQVSPITEQHVDYLAEAINLIEQHNLATFDKSLAILLLRAHELKSTYEEVLAKQRELQDIRKARKDEQSEKQQQTRLVVERIIRTISQAIDEGKCTTIEGVESAMGAKLERLAEVDPDGIATIRRKLKSSYKRKAD